MKYVPGNLYINTSASAIAELIAYFASAVALESFGKKPALCLGFMIAAIGAVLLIIVGP